jgi:hypothetical protein
MYGAFGVAAYRWVDGHDGPDLYGGRIRRHRPGERGVQSAARPLFNNPEGDTIEQYAITRQVEDNIDAAPKGSVIRMAFYSINLSDFADKLIAARGVYVKLLMDQHSNNATWKRLVAELGSKVNTKTSASSYAALCYGGRLAHHYTDGKPSSWLHTKYYLFSGGGNGLYHNDESDLKLTNSTTYLAYLTNFNDQLASLSAPTAKERALGQRPTIPVDPRQADDS